MPGPKPDPRNIAKGGSVLDGKPAGADKNLDFFHGIRPRLLRYSIGLLPPRDILMRVSLYQRM